MNRLTLLGTLLISASGCHTREQALDCFYKRADRNHDGVIDLKELDNAIYRYLPWYEYGPFKLFGGVNRIMKDCDANKDKKLTREESYEMQDTCLETCFKRDKAMSTFDCK